MPDRLSTLFGRIADKAEQHERAVPSSWRGGRLAALWKKKGTRQVCSNSRGILISDHAGKVFTGCLASEVDGPVQAVFAPSQAGGLPCMGKGCVAHRSRAFIQRCRRRKTTGVIRFGSLFFNFLYGSLLQELRRDLEPPRSRWRSARPPATCRGNITRRAG